MYSCVVPCLKFTYVLYVCVIGWFEKECAVQDRIERVWNDAFCFYFNYIHSVLIFACILVDIYDGYSFKRKPRLMGRKYTLWTDFIFGHNTDFVFKY